MTADRGKIAVSGKQCDTRKKRNSDQMFGQTLVTEEAGLKRPRGEHLQVRKTMWPLEETTSDEQKRDGWQDWDKDKGWHR